MPLSTCGLATRTTLTLFLVISDMSSSIASSCNCGMSLVVPAGYTHSQCEACQNYWFPTSIEFSEDAIVPLGRTAPFSCPRCSIDLEVGKIGQTEVCFCSNCRGFVIDSESLGRVINARRASYSGPEDQPSLVDANELDVHGTCPACFAKMEAHHYCGPGNIVLDTCMGCHLAWLDHGELAKIIRAPGRR